MKNLYRVSIVIILISIVFLPGCSVVIGIFSAGVWTAIVLVLLMVGLLAYGWRKNQ